MKNLPSTNKGNYIKQWQIVQGKDWSCNGSFYWSSDGISLSAAFSLPCPIAFKMRVTSVIILLESGRQNVFILLYREI